MLKIVKILVFKKIFCSFVKIFLMKRLLCIMVFLFLGIATYAPEQTEREEYLFETYEEFERIDQREDRIDALQVSIMFTESRGRYHVRGMSGEYGAYQFMWRTWTNWSRQYAGEVLDISCPRNQDAVARYKIESMVDQGYDDETIIAFWNSGRTDGWENMIGTNSHGVYYNVPRYVQTVMNNMDIAQKRIQLV